MLLAELFVKREEEKKKESVFSNTEHFSFQNLLYLLRSVDCPSGANTVTLPRGSWTGRITYMYALSYLL